MADESINYRSFVVGLWLCHEEWTRCMLPVANYETLKLIALDLRPHSGGRWDGMSPEVDARRWLLLADVAEQGARVLGRPWPWPDDLPPAVPADAAALGDDV